jgi:hypothetical protein
MRGDHEGHDYSMIHTDNGCCDCGDATAWREAVRLLHNTKAPL